MSTGELAIIPEQGDILQPVTLEALNMMDRSRIEMQLAAARKNPRPEIALIEGQVRRRVCRSVEVAELCYYSLKRHSRDSDEPKLITGGSIKLANIALGHWGNTLSGAFTSGNDGKVIKAMGLCWDLETNTQNFLEAQRRIVDKHGRPYSYDMQVTTAGACISIAKRNAINQILGDDLIIPLYKQCMKTVAGTSEDLIERRNSALRYFNSRKISNEQILAVLEKDAIDKIDVDDVAILRGLANAIKDKQITIQDAFDMEESEDPTMPSRKQKLEDKLRDIRDKKAQG